MYRPTDLRLRHREQDRPTPTTHLAISTRYFQGRKTNIQCHGQFACQCHSQFDFSHTDCLFVHLLSPASSASMGIWMENDAIHEDVRALKQQVKNLCAHAVSGYMHRAKPYGVFFPLLFRECRNISCEV